MKKVFLTIAFATLAMAANAQFILGGQLGFNTNGGKINVEKTALTPEYDYPNAKSMGLTIAPTVSYVINEKMQAGLSINFSMNTSKTVDNILAYQNDKEAYTKVRNTSFGVAPYFRYYLATIGKLNFFCEATLGFSVSPRSYTNVYSDYLGNVDNEIDGPTKTTDLYLAVVPGANYKFNDRWSADLYIDLAGIGFSHNSVKSYVGDDLVRTNNTNTFGLLANATAQTLNNHFGNFRIGFNYHF